MKTIPQAQTTNCILAPHAAHVPVSAAMGCGMSFPFDFMKKNFFLAVVVCAGLLATPAHAQFQWANRVASTTNTDDELHIGMTVDSQGNAYVTGWFDGANNFGGTTLASKTGGGQDIFVAKYNSTGALQWARRAGGNASSIAGERDAGRDAGRGLGVDNLGNVYVTGGFFGTADFGNFTLTASGNRQFFLAKYDNTGTVQWARQSTGGNGGDDGVYGTGLTVDSAGNSYALVVARNGAPITFGSTPVSTPNNTSGSTFLVKYDNTGAVQWTQLMTGEGQTYATKVAVDAAGNVYVRGGYERSTTIGNSNLVTAVSANNVNGKSMFVAKFNSSGSLVWVQQSSGAAAGEGGVAVDQSGNVYVSGAFDRASVSLGGISLPNAGSQDAFVAKYNSAGVAQWARRAGGATFDFYLDLALDAQGNVYTIGTLGSDAVTPNGSGGAIVAKYNSAGTLQSAYSASGPPGNPVSSVAAKVAVDTGGNVFLAGWYLTPTTFGANVLQTQGDWNYFLTKLAGQTITFGVLASKTVGDAPFTLSATASSGLPVAYTSSNPGVATVNGATVTIVGAGTTTITASQSGNAANLAAASVLQSLVVTPRVVTRPVIISPVTAAGRVGQAFSYTISADNVPTSFGATGLPGGLAVNAANGQIAGTPTASGTFNVAITASNTAGTDTRTLVLTINLPTATVPNVAGTYSGREDVTLTVIENGVVVDTQSTSGSNPGVVVTQNGNQFSWTISAPDPFGGGNVSLTRTATLSGNNIVSITGPAAGLASLPGLVITQNEIISGTGIVEFGRITMNVVGRVRGTQGGVPGGVDVVSTVVFTGTVAPLPPVPAITSALSAIGTTGQTFAYTIAANNGPTLYGATGLPAGLTLNAANGQIAGTPTTSGTFNVVISASNVTGTDTETLVLTINAAPQPPTINTPPASSAVCPGSTVTLSVTASGSGTLTYQWIKGTTLLPGEIGRTLTIANVDATKAGSYSVVVANNVGPTPSSAAVVSLNVPASITTPPQPVTVTRGGQAVFMVAVTGTPTPSIQWFKGTTALPGQTGTTLTLNNVQSVNAGDYKVQVTNACAMVESAVVGLTVNGPVEITTPPASQTTCVGSEVMFTVLAAGTSPIGIQWRSNGVAIAGATGGTLVLNNVQTNFAANYDAVLANVVNSVTSSVAVLTVNFAPYITQQPAGLTVTQGQANVSFTVVASGKPAPTYQWRKDGVNIPNAINASYTIASAAPTSAGNYDVVVSNSCGVTNSVAVALVVNGPVTLTTLPRTQTANKGATVTFSVRAAGTPPFAYQWRFKGVNIPDATNADYTLTNVQLTDAGDYDVVVTNIVNSVTSTPVAVLTVLEGVTITQQPVSQTVLPGTTVTFVVAATGTAPLAYQWKKNGAVIPSATSASYTINSASTNDVAVYSVVVSNIVGPVPSNDATLAVVLRQLKVGDVQVTGATVGSPVSVPITLVGDGTEHKVSLSVAFDPAVVTYSSVPGGADVASRPKVGAVAGATVTVNNPGGGQPLGVTVEMPAGQTFPAGASEVARLVFAAASASQVACALVQGDLPVVVRQVQDTNGAVLPSEFANGSVTLKTPVSPVVADATGLLGETTGGRLTA